MMAITLYKRILISTRNSILESKSQAWKYVKILSFCRSRNLFMSTWLGMQRSSRTLPFCLSVHFSEHSRTQISWSEPVPLGSCPVSVSSWSLPSWCWPSKRLWWTCHHMSERQQLMPSQSFTGKDTCNNMLKCSVKAVLLKAKCSVANSG